MCWSCGGLFDLCRASVSDGTWTQSFKVNYIRHLLGRSPYVHLSCSSVALCCVGRRKQISPVTSLDE